MTRIALLRRNPRLAHAAQPRNIMNKSEQRYRDHLELRRKAGELEAWIWEPFKLKLAKKTFYTPDFLVVTHDHVLECHEFKGFWRDDARVKVKVAASQFPWFRFVGVTWDKKGGQYLYEEILPAPR